jgi:hypothetical protein
MRVFSGGADGGSRTRTVAPTILSRLRLPFRHAGIGLPWAQCSQHPRYSSITSGTAWRTFRRASSAALNAAATEPAPMINPDNKNGMLWP